MTTTLKAFLASGLLLASSVATAETIERDICVFDIAGKVGPTIAAMQDWRTEAMNWGLDANLRCTPTNRWSRKTSRPGCVTPP